jgi:hypothetical protein
MAGFCANKYQIRLIKEYLGNIIAALFSTPQASRKEKGIFGDTPNPGKGLRPLHSF